MSDSAPDTFEEALTRLEDSVERLENGEISLEEALNAFESGIAASRVCATKLDQTRKRVQVLVEEEGGDLRLEFLEDGEDR